jgi:renalase
MEDSDTDVLIVGAGMTGLMAAQALRRASRDVVLVDKGRSVGGRLATRRVGLGRADHGAQFFTVRTPTFRAWADQWLATGLVYKWSEGWSDGSLATSSPDGHPRYAVRGGMNALAKHLVEGLDVRVNVCLTSIRLAGDRWQAEDETGAFHQCRALVLTPPVPQALALLDAGGARLARDDRVALDRISYAPCVAGLFSVDGAVHLPEPGAIQRPNEPISWIADNKRKGISPEATIITVHAGPAYSQQLWESTDDEAIAALHSGLQTFLDPAARVLDAQLKRWRYAQPTTLHPARCLLASEGPALSFAGDAFGAPRVEGAALSGIAAAEGIIPR